MIISFWNEKFILEINAFLMLNKILQKTMSDSDNKAIDISAIDKWVTTGNALKL